MENMQTFKDFRYLNLRDGQKPLLLSPDLRIIVEVEHALYRIAFEFLMSIAEPLTRSVRIHEYEINQMSLYTGMVLQYSAEDIIKVLEILSKNAPPEQMKEYIRKHTQKMGLARLYLKESKYYLHIATSISEEVLRNMEKLQDVISQKKKLSRTPNYKDILHELAMDTKEVIEENPELKEIQQQIDRQYQEINQEELEQMAHEVDQIQNQDQV